MEVIFTRMEIRANICFDLQECLMRIPYLVKNRVKSNLFVVGQNK